MSEPASRRSNWFMALFGALFLGSLGTYLYRQTQPSAPVAERPVYTGDAAVVERFQCYRCHDAPNKLVPAKRERHCVRCHQAILKGDLDADYDAERTAGWKTRIHSLTRVPTLVGVERLRRDWLVAFLQRPHDLRPGLGASMPRFRMTPAEAEAIARHFLPAAESAGDEVALGDVARGRTLYLTNGCAVCHHFGGAGLPAVDRLAGDAVRLAPDLRHTRARMTSGSLLQWLTRPRAVKADTLMPDYDLSPAQRRDLAAFLLHTPLAPEPKRAIPARLPLLSRRVTFAEVQKRVFKAVCWHCHSDPVPVGGDGGPGNTGGFGFAGKGLDLGTYESVLRGGRGPEGERIDILAPNAEGVPHVVAVLLARHAEVAGKTTPLRGMPLGLPPRPLEEIQLIDSWIAQGAPHE